MINVVVLLYRDSYFFSQYGPAVRDLQILFELEKITEIKKITVINRPVSIAEKMCGRKIKRKRIETDKIDTIDSFSWDLFGPLKGRAWSEKIYNDIVHNKLAELYDENCINLLLDFLPIGTFSADLKNKWIYWYDLIDNFTKHNRFTPRDRELVRKKYKFACSYANVITGVSLNALNEFPSTINKLVIPNRIFGFNKYDFDACNVLKTLKEPEFDFGFIGFITDKFDFSFIERLSKEYKIAIYGKCYDRKIKKKIESMQNVTYFGSFKYNQLREIMLTFKVGLLPYMAEKSHDESPLKIYEYLKNNRPCLTSMDFELNNKYIINYNNGISNKTINEMLGFYNKEKITYIIDDEMYLLSTLRKFISNNIIDGIAI
ncbi:hypothetical protein [Enterobacter sp. EC-ML559]|uniref:hypothetical protein n=1 Tax=Enterobacter sp. EC-ML559 TaxID=3037554 RepID=UPI0024A78360|nr:hypothetical protein [Enterobacter sp. EC-ML559]MDI5881245.1 hypothetical protein [Enterobacter sp. EC-ML559]